MSDRPVFAVLWSLAGRLSVKAVAFGFSVFLARLLTPADFGLVGMVSVFLSVATLFFDCGFPLAIIRKTDRVERDFSTVFVFQFAASLVSAAAMCAASPLVAGFFREPELTPIVCAMSLNLLLSAIASVPAVKLRIRLDFRTLSVVQTLTALVSGGIGLFLAARGMGPWAIVWQGLVSGVVNATLLCAAAGWLPRFEFAPDTFREFFAFGWRQLTVSFAQTVYQQSNAFLIGRRFSSADVGLYNRAEYYTSEPSTLVTQGIGDVCYPDLCRLRPDPVAFRRRYRAVSAVQAVVSLTGFGVLVMFTAEIIEWLIGPQWLGCVPMIRVLAVGYAVEPIRRLLLTPCYVDGRMDVVLRLEVAEIAVAFGFLFVSLPFGVLALCWARTAYQLFSLALNLFVCRRYLRR